MSKILLILVWLLLLAGIASAQKTCTRISSTSQNCLATVSWTASVVDATHDAPANYVVRRADGTGAMAVIGTVLASVTSFQNSFTDSGGISHCYNVSATAGTLSSPPSTQACWTTPAIQNTPPSTPSGFTISAVDNSTLTLSWDDGAIEDKTEIWGRSAQGKGKQFAMVGVVPQDATFWEWNNLKARATYCAHIRAVNGAGPSTYTPISCATTNR